jgi:hypothetical protein
MLRQQSFGPTKMLWDTGAHSMIITKEMIPLSFRNHLNDPIHDPYRSEDESTVQMELFVKLPGFATTVDVFAFTRPQSMMTNHFLGIIFGQRMGIEKMVARTIPRAILQMN